MHRFLSPQEWRHRGATGFSLVELLVAMSVLALLVFAMARLLDSTFAIWRQSEARLDAFREARAALQMLSRDLAAITVPVRSEDDGKLPYLTTNRLYQNSPADGNHQVYGLIPMRNPGQTDFCAIGYYCAWDAARSAFVLRRHFQSSDDLFTRIQALTLPTTAPADIYQPNAADEDLAVYVWDLRVIPFDYSSGSLAAQTTPVSYSSRNDLPAYLEISFKVMSPGAAQKLAGRNVQPGDWTNTNSPIYRNEILPYAREFATRVKVRSSRIP